MVPKSPLTLEHRDKRLLFYFSLWHFSLVTQFFPNLHSQPEARPTRTVTQEVTALIKLNNSSFGVSDTPTQWTLNSPHPWLHINTVIKYNYLSSVITSLFLCNNSHSDVAHSLHAKTMHTLYSYFTSYCIIPLTKYYCNSLCPGIFLCLVGKKKW